MAQKIRLTVSKKELIAPHMYLVTFRLVSPPTITFTAGQNMMLMIAPGVNRTMSIASPPSSDTELLMLHDVSPMGPGSQWTMGLTIGDSANVVAPTGGALSFLPTPKRKVLIATGTGIAPFRSMILDALERRLPSVIMLYWGVRHEEDIYWKNEFDMLAKNQLNFSWHLILSKPTSVWRGMTGHVTEHVLNDEKDLANNEFYLCGSRAMTEEVRSKLLDQNVPKEQIKSELFF